MFSLDFRGNLKCKGAKKCTPDHEELQSRKTKFLPCLSDYLTNLFLPLGLSLSILFKRVCGIMFLIEIGERIGIGEKRIKWTFNERSAMAYQY